MKKIGLFLLSLMVLSSSVAFASTTVTIKGSTTVLPITQAVAEAYMKVQPATNISISAGGSGDGIKALLDKSTDIAMSSRDLKKEELSLAEKNGVKPLVKTVAIDAIVPVVHPRNKVSNLTIDQLALIYTGKITNWKELGGDDLQIVLVSRDTSSGTFESWRDIVLKGEKVTPKAQLQASNGAIVQVVSKNRYAIGYIGIGYLDKSIKALQVNGIVATPQTAISKEYPIARGLYMITNGEPTGETANFINYLLSRDGQVIVEKTGFVPLSK